MINKPVIEIVESDLAELIKSGATESKQLEFKRELPEASDQGKVKFLRSITAFANTAGGDLIYGIEAADGVASAIVPLTLPSEDHVLQRLESLCATGVEPRLTGVQFRWVKLSQGASVLVVRVSRSWNAPHRVTASNHSHFYGRNSAGVFRMDVTDLRRAFTLSGDISERIQAFRTDRVLALSGGQSPMPLQHGAIGLLHIVPLQAFSDITLIDVASRSSAITQIHPIGVSGYNDRLNIDGRLAFGATNQGRTSGYTQLYRNGIIEAAIVYSTWGDENTIASESYELDIVTGLRSYFPALRDLGVSTPAYIFFSFVGVAGYRLAVSNRRFFSSEKYVADRDVLNFPEVTITDWQQDPINLLRPLFDTVWNAFGLGHSFNYNDAGEWTGQR